MLERSRNCRFFFAIRSNKLDRLLCNFIKRIIITRTLHERANHWNNRLHNGCASQAKIDKTVVHSVDIVMNTFIGGSVERLTGLIGR